MAPAAPNPRIIIDQDAGSGAADTGVLTNVKSSKATKSWATVEGVTRTRVIAWLETNPAKPLGETSLLISPVAAKVKAPRAVPPAPKKEKV